MSFIKDLRTELGLTQAKLASELGVALLTVQRWEKEDFNPSEKHQIKIAELKRSITAGRVSSIRYKNKDTNIHISMYTRDHEPPHIHVYYKDISDKYFYEENRFLNGDELPNNIKKIIIKWVELYTNQIKANWIKCANVTKPEHINGEV